MAAKRESTWRTRLLGLALPPLLLLAIGLGIWLVRRDPVSLFGYVAGGLAAISIGWIFVSAVWPGSPDRRCPECGAEALERLDRTTTTGLRCASCGFVDDSASSFLIAEAEGPLEETVLRERETRRLYRARKRD